MEDPVSGSTHSHVRGRLFFLPLLHEMTATRLFWFLHCVRSGPFADILDVALYLRHAGRRFLAEARATEGKVRL